MNVLYLINILLLLLLLFHDDMIFVNYHFVDYDYDYDEMLVLYIDYYLRINYYELKIIHSLMMMFWPIFDALVSVVVVWSSLHWLMMVVIMIL